MPEYRIYTFDAAGEIILPPQVFQSEDDQGAFEKALQAVGGSEVEVWRSLQLVVRLPTWVRPTARISAVGALLVGAT